MEVFQYEPAKDGYIWEYNGQSLSEWQEEFQKAAIFNGKTAPSAMQKDRELPMSRQQKVSAARMTEKPQCPRKRAQPEK